MSGHPDQGKNEARLTHERLLELVSYDPLTGLFSSIAPRPGVRRSASLGHVEKVGHRRICIDGMRFLAHRLAWFYVHGVWPVGEIDHRDLSKDNNRLDNLREATTPQNHQNTPPVRGSKSGLKGAHWNSARGTWHSAIKVNGRSIRLGRFETPEEAHAAYAAAVKEHHGEFGRLM